MSRNTMEDCKKRRARRKNPFNPNADGKRRATIMKRVHMARKRDRRSEIRTNNEYTSRGGRDGYKKLDQEKFNKTGKWEKRDGLWLDSRTGSDGELKDPACKKVSQLIMEYNTQESQGTFKSVGTSDVLTQALSRPEHPGRIRGQLKFIKQSQYFNLNRNVEPSFDQENVPTVDQHNSLKASCSIQEKQHGVSDPPTMPVDSQECKLYIFNELHGGQLLVTFGRAWLKSLPIDTVHGIPLGNQIEVSIPYTIMGFDMPVFLRYLEELCRINGRAEKFMFVSPTLISPVRTDTVDAGMRERADALLGFLRDAPKGRLYLVPHNRGRHWVLGVINPWEDLVLYFDLLRKKKRDDFTNLMKM
ncbi:hypothetical protein TIFTF001_045264 [Ficus carica]|uniref:Ubiquitin-like protease family profile domain-containing protein n=1 Tax=Ficus carica TaxID=3494 RepID=A0AA88CKH3_FICCA|nr:hypothetical protein TIFTF001_045264 [Ficus carica]